MCSYKTGTVREKLRAFLADLRQDNPHVLENLLAAMGRIDAERLLDKRFMGGPPATGAPENDATMLLSPEKLARAAVAIDSASCQDVGLHMVSAEREPGSSDLPIAERFPRLRF